GALPVSSTQECLQNLWLLTTFGFSRFWGLLAVLGRANGSTTTPPDPERNNSCLLQKSICFCASSIVILGAPVEIVSSRMVRHRLRIPGRLVKKLARTI